MLKCERTRKSELQADEWDRSCACNDAVDLALLLPRRRH